MIRTEEHQCVISANSTVTPLEIVTHCKALLAEMDKGNTESDVVHIMNVYDRRNAETRILYIMGEGYVRLRGVHPDKLVRQVVRDSDGRISNIEVVPELNTCTPEKDVPVFHGSLLRLDELVNESGDKLLREFIEETPVMELTMVPIEDNSIDEIFKDPWLDYTTEVPHISLNILSNFIHDRIVLHPALSHEVWWKTPIHPEIAPFIHENGTRLGLRVHPVTAGDSDVPVKPSFTHLNKLIGE